MVRFSNSSLTFQFKKMVWKIRRNVHTLLHTVSTVCNACSHNISQTPEKRSSDEVEDSPTHLEQCCSSNEVVDLE